MALRFVQLKEQGGARRLVALNDAGLARRVQGADTLLDLANAALKVGATLAPRWRKAACWRRLTIPIPPT